MQLIILIRSLLWCLMILFKPGRHFDIYIPRLSVHGLHVLTILTKCRPNKVLSTRKCEHLLTLTTVRLHAHIMKT